MTAAGPTRSFRSALAAIATTLAGARDCASAAEAGRRPSDRALRAVGIARRDWDGIGSR
ncbi:hypothetical protein [Aureimonas leprariae]|uniref:hypothetical protein n=1 Tax=Plantimonas leprariae TaxID=2615207 RepID=UPI0013869692|nr:hypothetical protein [Aureimonas leprariae]